MLYLSLLRAATWGNTACVRKFCLHFWHLQAYWACAKSQRILQSTSKGLENWWCDDPVVLIACWISSRQCCDCICACAKWACNGASKPVCLRRCRCCNRSRWCLCLLHSCSCGCWVLLTACKACTWASQVQKTQGKRMLADFMPAVCNGRAKTQPWACVVWFAPHTSNLCIFLNLFPGITMLRRRSVDVRSRSVFSHDVECWGAQDACKMLVWILWEWQSSGQTLPK